MKLQSNSGTFPKFTTIGDKYAGTFVSFTEDKPGKYGPETILVLAKDDGSEISIRCPASLKRTLSDNRDVLVAGARVVCEYVRDVPTNKGNPARIIDVDVEPPAAGYVAPTRAATPPPAEPSDADEAPSGGFEESPDEIPF